MENQISHRLTFLALPLRTGCLLAMTIMVTTGMLVLQPNVSIAETAAPASTPATESSSDAADASSHNAADASMASSDAADDVDANDAQPEKRDGQRRGRKNINNGELEEKDMPEALAVLRDYRPELVKRFEDWASRHPENARTMLSRSVPMMQRLIRLRREDPVGYRLAIEDLRYYNFTAELSKQLRAARSDNDAPQVEVLSLKLRTLLTRHFEVRQKIREREIQKLEQRIDQLRKQLSERAEAHEKILDSRFDQLSDPSVKAPW